MCVDNFLATIKDMEDEERYTDGRIELYQVREEDGTVAVYINKLADGTSIRVKFNTVFEKMVEKMFTDVLEAPREKYKLIADCFKSEEYRTLDEIFTQLGNELTPTGIASAFKTGRWFLKEEKQTDSPEKEIPF